MRFLVELTLRPAIFLKRDETDHNNSVRRPALEQTGSLSGSRETIPKLTAATSAQLEVP